MKWVYKTIRTILMVLLVLMFVVPAGLYVALSISGVQKTIRNTAQSELSSLLGVNVTIDDVAITPFNRVKLYGVKVDDAYGEAALEVKKLGAGISLWSFITQGQIELSYAEIIGMKARIYKQSSDSPLNIQPIIDALASKDDGRPPSQFDFRINTVVIRNGDVRYDVLDNVVEDNRFSAEHLHITELNADVQLPVIRNEEFEVKLRRFAFEEERSGFRLDELSGLFKIDNHKAVLTDFQLHLPKSLLAFEDIKVEYDSLKTIAKDILTSPISVSLKPESRVTPADLRAFVPVLANFEHPVELMLGVNGVLSQTVNVEVSAISGNAFNMNLLGRVKSLTERETMTFDVSTLNVNVNGGFAEHYAAFALSEQVRSLLVNSGQISLTGNASGSLSKSAADIVLLAEKLDISSTAELTKVAQGYEVSATVKVNEADLQHLLSGVLAPGYLPSSLDAVVSGSAVIGPKESPAQVEMLIPEMIYRENHYRDISLQLNKSGENYQVTFASENESLDCNFTGDVTLLPTNYKLKLKADVADVDLTKLMPGGMIDDITGKIDVSLSGRDADHLEGYVDLTDVRLQKIGGELVGVDSFKLVSSRIDDNVRITLDSDIADGELQGRYHLSSFVPMCRDLIAQVMPVLAYGERADVTKLYGNEHKVNDIVFDFTLKNLSAIEPFVKMPVRVIYPISMTGRMNSELQKFDFVLTAPYIQQGNKLIEETSLSVSIDGKRDSLDTGTAQLLFSTLMPTKDGMMKITDRASATDNIINNSLTFKINRKRQFGGTLNLMAALSRNDEGELVTDIDVGKSNMVFNDTVWSISPSRISLAGKNLVVNEFHAGREGQSITINGRSSTSAADSITVELDNVNLDYVFETLSIPNVTFGGDATGRLYAKQVLTSEPVAYTPRLNVHRLKYNYSLLGEGVIESRWITPSKAVDLNVTINQDNGRTTYVSGQIKPAADSLDLRFDADRVPVGFLYPVMSAFATEVSGEATGDVHLWGSFSLVQLVGKLYGSDMTLKLGVNNTAYHFSDSILFTPDLISFKDITIKDDFGHTALVNGKVIHHYLKDAGFDFHISDARDIMVYDFKEGDDRTWYGRVFGNGEVVCHGEPGYVKVNVDMSTATGTQFNLVLSDALSAGTYDFITFRDRDQARKDSIAALTAPPVVITELRNKMNSIEQNNPSVYDVNLALEVTPQAMITLVMDPVAGDRIRSFGHGNMRLGYNSRDDDMRLNGTYTVERGTYNFTLQDIIIKEFTIEDGSTITFHGDANAAQLDIRAAYTLNANLTDLDESFAADKELNRTNVPVQAVLKVSGDMRRPEIGYDLNFPTLTQDIDRKVRSIVNTEEMMNRQIIYLLALNRFYTPDYMNSTNRSNELMSVASSTISSQLSSMLGQLSENWAIAPNFRSDRGDFSDVEVNLALSSHLLNNRLLLNGNFGYRDKSLNNNSFIGDFDIEYLLNRSGSFRLKAYNRYNDQNYYVKSALTTQGVGVVFKHDFDNLIDWIFDRKNK